jgi:NAD(P)-dependent dehydrogenase (short-subunit alcohol dehydrogenase family)
MELQGKTAVITGGASGLGLATAKQLAKAGVNLVLGDIEQGPLDEVVAEFKGNGVNVIGVNIDVRSADDVNRLRDEAVKAFGTAHIIFNNAGVGGGPLLGTDKKMWDWVMDINVDGVVNGINTFVPMFLDQNEGHVINTGSLAGLGGVPGMGSYCASKFAVVGMTEVLFHELAYTGKDVHASLLCPGFVKTRIHESGRNLPKELASFAENPVAKAVQGIAAEAVNSGIDPSIIGELVEDAIVNNKFWILPHMRSAIRTTEQRLQWMQGGDTPGIDLMKAAKN